MGIIGFVIFFLFLCWILGNKETEYINKNNYDCLDISGYKPHTIGKPTIIAMTVGFFLLVKAIFC